MKLIPRKANQFCDLGLNKKTSPSWHRMCRPVVRAFECPVDCIRSDCNRVDRAHPSFPISGPLKSISFSLYTAALWSINKGRDSCFSSPKPLIDTHPTSTISDVDGISFCLEIFHPLILFHLFHNLADYLPAVQPKILKRNRIEEVKSAWLSDWFNMLLWTSSRPRLLYWGWTNISYLEKVPFRWKLAWIVNGTLRDHLSSSASASTIDLLV